MPEPKIEIDEYGHMTITSDSGCFTLGVSLWDIFHAMTDEQREIAADCITWGEIRKAAMKRLMGDSIFWSSDDPRKALEFLARVEERFSNGYIWGALQDLNNLAKNMVTHEHIYWMLYHGTKFGPEFLRNNGIKSNYTCDLPEFSQFERTVQSILRNKEHHTFANTERLEGK